MLNSKEIIELNKSQLILMRFLKQCVELLPILLELQQKKNPTMEDDLNNFKIRALFESFKFDSFLGVIIFNSDILHQLEDTYNEIINTSNEDDVLIQQTKLNSLIKEFQRIENSLQKSMLN